LDLCGSGYRPTLRVTEAALWVPHQKWIISLCESGHRSPERSTHGIVCRIQQEEEGREGAVEERQLVILPSFITIRPPRSMLFFIRFVQDRVKQ